MELPLPSHDVVIWWLRLLLLLAIALVMGDAALDKVRDWQGNAGYAREVFSKSILRSLAVPMLFVLALMMGAAAIASAAGIVQLLLGRSPGFGLVGAVLSALVFLGLLFGLQIGKNHEAAKGVTVYFLVSAVAVWSMCF